MGNITKAQDSPKDDFDVESFFGPPSSNHLRPGDCGSSSSNHSQRPGDRDRECPPESIECEAQGFSWLNGSCEEPRMRLAIIKAEIPAFFYEGYVVDVAETEDELYQALRKGDTPCVRQLLRHADVNGPLQCVPYTPMQVACECGNLDIVKMIKERGANLNLVHEGYAALVTASRHGFTDIVSYLLQNGAFIDQKAGKEIIPSFIKSSFETEVIERAHIRHFPMDLRHYLIELCDPYWGNTALIQACREHHLHIVNELIDNGCSLEVKNMAGNTALHVACLSRTADTHVCHASPYVPSTVIIGGNQSIVRTLLEAGADTNVINSNNETPLQRCFRVIAKDDPLSWTDWGFDSHDQIEILTSLLQAVGELLAAGCDVRGNRRMHANDFDDIMRVNVQIVKVCQTLSKLNACKQHLCESLLLLFFESVRTSNSLFAFDKLECIISLELDLEERFRDKLLVILHNHLSLKQWCRVVIRRSISQPLHHHIKPLNLPSSIKEYVLYKEYLSW